MKKLCNAQNYSQVNVCIKVLTNYKFKFRSKLIFERKNMSKIDSLTDILRNLVDSGRSSLIFDQFSDNNASISYSKLKSILAEVTAGIFVA
jgi:hypothetical protein